MEIILIPGFWLDASSWDGVVPILDRAGHHPHPITLPGMESPDARREGVTLRDHVAAVVTAVDQVAPGDVPVVLVGHSGGAAVAQGAADALPDRVARVIYVDAVPLPDGGAVNEELPVVGDEIPLPEWDAFGAEDLVDLDDDLRARFRERAIPTPARVARDPQRLTDERRHDVPVTVISCEFPSSQIQEWIVEGAPWTAELARVRDVDYIDLPTGHWPQLTRPDDLARALVAALAGTA